MADRDPVAPDAEEPDAGQEPQGSQAPDEVQPPDEVQQPDEPPVLPDRARDDSDEGWGGRGDGGERDDDWYERERPPHW